MRFRLSYLLGVLLLVVAALPVQAGIGQPAHAAFAVATVKSAPGADANTGSWSPPDVGSFTATHVSLELLLQLAFGVDASQIANKPGWLGSNLYDVRAKPNDGVLLSREELKPRLQDLLHQRFGLIAHVEQRFRKGYALVVAPGGPRLKPTQGDHFAGFRVNVSPGQMRGANWSMAIFAKYLTSVAGLPVVDDTSVQGSYDVAFSYAADPDHEDGDSSLPSLKTALEQATGLLLKPRQLPVETIVIDAVNKVPSEN